MSRSRVLAGLLGCSAWLLLAGCLEGGERWYFDELTPACNLDEVRCSGTRLERCVAAGKRFTFQLDRECADDGLVCAVGLERCVSCVPGSSRCEGPEVQTCSSDGTRYEPSQVCDELRGEACRGGNCVNLCLAARKRRSNVGCEYWAVDLDNARISSTSNAAAQQFAVVVSNPEPDVSAEVEIDQDDSAPGDAEPQVTTVARATVPPFSLRVFKLGPREVDGSEPGTFDTGTGTALSRAAFRIRSAMPVVAYQFNPLENVSVFSNDASLLKPVEALIPTSTALTDSYVVLGWPQTIARSSDPRTNFGNDLRSFLTLVGTQAETQVRITTTARVIAGGPVAETPAGGVIEAVLQPFEVLNLETADFLADFTGTQIATDGPVVVFSGNEASDAPAFDELSDRRCCADHLEEQLDPIRTAGRKFVASVSPNRIQALVAAGAEFAEVVPQPEYFRLIAATALGARVQTTLAGHETIELPAKGSFVELTSTESFAITSDAPLMLMSVSPSQAAASIPTGLPGGDPSSLIVPPTEQFRSTYVFLTPDKYSFDFIRIIAEPDTEIVFDGEPLALREGCSTSPLNASPSSGAEAVVVAARWVVHTCQLSFPLVDSSLMSPQNLQPGRQNDGVHRLAASRPVGVLVDGFDAYVSYAYAGGTELEYIVPE